MERLSRPLSELQAHYSVVVIGSGYGGAVAASRFARAGQSVCVLERGREWVPQDFPDTPGAAVAELQVASPVGRIGAAEALLDLHPGDDMNVLVACGLGGGSLINAAVAIRADPRVFVDPIWPKGVRDDLEEGLEQGYGQARRMLQPKPFPDQPGPDKLAALERSARRLEAPCWRPELVIDFDRCSRCGDCVAGCKLEAKGSTTRNYLPDAVRHGAAVFTEVAVTHIERQTRWRIGINAVSSGRQRFDAPEMWVEADWVVLGAGALGSTEILLRSARRGLSLSSRLGTRFSGNGDAIGYAYNGETRVNGIGRGARPGASPPGPCITGLIDMRRVEPFEEGMVIEEGALPSAMALALPAAFAAAGATIGTDTDHGFLDAAGEGLRQAESLARGAYHGALQHTQTFLVMAHDDAGGRLELEGERLAIRWPEAGRQAVFERIGAVLQTATEALGGTYVENPISSQWLGRRLITVHPLGGCPMGESAEDGVVDHLGRVFDGKGGVHPGLLVCDGSIIPRSLGVNPLLTITALAERNCARIAAENGWRIDYLSPGQSPLPAVTGPGLAFTERMAGYLALEPALDYREAAEQGKRDQNTFAFTLTIEACEAGKLLDATGGEARVYGSVEAPFLGEGTLLVRHGSFRLFIADPDRAGARRMTYRLPLYAASGRQFLATGFKELYDDPGFDLWADTTTLFLDLEDASGVRIGRGTLSIAVKDFVRQLSTLQVTGVDSVSERLKVMARFGRYFAGNLFDLYGPGHE